MNKSSPGPDRLPYAAFKKMDPEVLASHFNLWQYASTPPDMLCIGRTIFLEKVMNTNRPLEHRPITIASFIIRCYHKVMANRLEQRLPFNVRQKGSMKGDGAAQNVWLLGSILSECKEKLKPVPLCFIDVKKAFDSVSHQSLLLAAQHLGVPPPLLEYLREFNGKSRTVFEINGARSSTVKVALGVKQGDPLSSYLFNSVLDMALADLYEGIGVEVNSCRINNLAYADDVILLASTPEGLQSQMDALVVNLEMGGLRISAGADGKSASMRVVVDGKAKKWWVDANGSGNVCHCRMQILWHSGICYWQPLEGHGGVRRKVE
eukprot:Seg1794.6 transcript_id=Seg1794.6/GoldUCD/mRNA.D3Y31 product="Retrovirus-related Pol polyprotein from type-1 retrotransposable element R2" pseudo=true protein_id=Seg1794.6/GoldUCD/D3Y31